MIKAMEEKIALFQQFLEDIAKKPQGAVARASSRGSGTTRLDEDQGHPEAQRGQAEPPNRSATWTCSTSMQEAEREEDRAAKDLLNLYDQYQSRRMREETFKRLLPSYKRKLDCRHQPPVGPAEPGAERRASRA